MYAGQAVEDGPVERVFEQPLHPYTQGLLASLPERSDRSRLVAIPAGRRSSTATSSAAASASAAPTRSRSARSCPGSLPSQPGRAARSRVSQREGTLPPRPGAKVPA